MLETQDTTPNGLAGFIAQLIEHGRAQIRSSALDQGAPAPEDELTRADALAREELLQEAPKLDLAAAQWAALSLYECTRSIVDRKVGTDELKATIRAPFSSPRNASIHWSVDLFFRHLPKIIGLASKVSRQDPIIDLLQQLGSEWPLSSVGMTCAPGPLELSRILDQEALRRLYLDRILTTGDRSRLNDPRVVAHLRSDLGGHPELSPRLQALLFPVPK